MWLNNGLFFIFNNTRHRWSTSHYPVDTISLFKTRKTCWMFPKTISTLHSEGKLSQTIGNLCIAVWWSLSVLAFRWTNLISSPECLARITILSPATSHTIRPYSNLTKNDIIKKILLDLRVCHFKSWRRCSYGISCRLCLSIIRVAHRWTFSSISMCVWV